MCQFLSAIVLKNSDVLWNPYTDSHEDLIAINNLRDNNTDNFVRVEFLPESHSDYGNPNAYNLKVDQSVTPDWFDSAMQERTVEYLRGIIERMIIKTPVTMLCGGSYILISGAEVKHVKSCVVKVMLGSSKVGEMLDSSKVGAMLDSSKVGTMWDSSKVGTMLDSSKVGKMRGSSKVGKMLNSSKVGTNKSSNATPVKTV